MGIVDIREIWYGRSAGARLSRTALLPLSWLYAAGWQAYLGTYRVGFKKASEPHVPVLCVGNLMVGGTGKSPLTIFLAGLLRSMGREVVVSASGYGSPRSESATVAPQGPLDPAEWGDEPAMLRWLIPDLPIIVGRRRVEAARLCHQHFHQAVMLMDDGFQHLPLHKHLTILLDPTKPANPHCLPAGPYREPRSNRTRASLVLPGQFEVVESSTCFEHPDGTAAEDPTEGRFSVLCALGQPDRFLRSLPGEPAVKVALPDHDPLRAGNLLERLPVDLSVVVTAKDWVKLQQRSDIAQRRFLVARHSVKIEPEDAFAKWLEERLDETQTAKGTAR